MIYAGFWIRIGACIVDTFVLILIFFSLMASLYGLDFMNMEVYSEGSSYCESYYSFQGGINFFLNYLLPAIIVITFWIFKSATPGKMATKLTIVDAKTGKKPTLIQFLLRYVGYFLSSIFFLGFIWIAFDKRKQGWHDKLASTVVIRDTQEKKVKFEDE